MFYSLVNVGVMRLKIAVNMLLKKTNS